jgi:hypothetical protein
VSIAFRKSLITLVAEEHPVSFMAAAAAAAGSGNVGVHEKSMHLPEVHEIADLDLVPVE